MIDPAGGGFLIGILNMVASFFKLLFSRKSTHAKKVEDAGKLQVILERQLESKTITENERQGILRRLKTIKFLLIEDIEDVPAELTELFYSVRLSNCFLDKSVKNSIKKDLLIDSKGFVKKSSEHYSFFRVILCLIAFCGTSFIERLAVNSSVIFYFSALIASFVIAYLFFGCMTQLGNIRMFRKVVMRYQIARKVIIPLMILLDGSLKEVRAESGCLLLTPLVLEDSWWSSLRKKILKFFRSFRVKF